MSEIAWVVAAAVLAYWIGYGQGSWRGRRQGYRDGSTEFDVWCNYCGRKAGDGFTAVHSSRIQGVYHPGCLALLEAELRETGNL